MSISKTYSPQETESKWYSYWLENRFFASQPNPDKEPYCVVIPPPNVTGVLHMGHMLNNTIQDVLVRKARMEGKEACWVPGTDHASIATEAKVVSMLRDQGIQKKDLTREEFLGHAMEWKDKYGGIILEQLKKLGCSCDWDRTRFTMDTNYYNAVIQVFVDLYNKGHIYRGIRMVNWDPQGLTALSDEEVIMKEVQQKLCYIKYEVVGMPDTFLTIATVRPETIMADAAICVHPDDERYKHLHNKKVRIPLINKEIPVITDEYVTMDFGTGCLKVTPAHDLNDYELGIKHNLPVIDILNEDGKLNEKAQIYVGVDRFDARKQIIKKLEAKGLLEKVEEYKSNVGTSERTGAVVEPRLSLQWFMKMKELSKPALENVMNDNIQLHPAKFKNTYKSWMENVKDWCISRQLWWGHRIPAFYMKDGRVIVANNKKEALKIARNKYQLFALSEIDLVQDEDVLDTWFSSWLWPFEVFDGLSNPGNADVKYYYPTNDLVTAPEILFFWVARMAIAGYEYFGEKPFSNVYLTGIVRDKLGRKMSKSLGNSPDPLDLIAKYGADGVRTGMLFSSPAGNDLPFDEKLCEQGRNFSNKIWNAFRLVKGWDVADLATPQANTVAIAWFEAKLNASIAEIKEHFDKFRISDALLATYKLIWDDFCAWYLEMIKPAYQQPIDRATLEATINFFEQLMELVHPFMPFITEEIWHEIRERKQGDSICVAKFPQAKPVDATLLAAADQAFEVIAQIRNLRNSKQISPKVELALFVKAADPKLYADFSGVIVKLANTTAPEMVTEKPAGTVSLIVKSDELYVPLADQLDAAKERENLLKELDYTRGFMDSVVKKLANEKFVANAKPDLLERERQKLADAEAKLKTIEEALAGL